MRRTKKIFGIILAISCLWNQTVTAGSWDPSLLVNTESFQILDEGDSTTDITIQFGDTLSRNLTYDRANANFSFDDDVKVTGNVVASGTLSGKTLTASDLVSCETITTDANGNFSCGAPIVISVTGATLAAVQARRDTDFTMTLLNTFYDVTFNLTDIESNYTVIEHNNTNTERIDIKETGYYVTTYHINANDAIVTHQLDARIRINGSVTLTGSLTIGRNYQNEYSPNVSTNIAYLKQGDYITLQAQRTTANTVINETVLTIIKLDGIKGEKGEKGDPGEDGGLAEADADLRYVNTSGDTMTGVLIIDQDADAISMDIDSEATTEAALRIDSTASSSTAPQILFGQNGTFDVNLFRDAADVLRTSDSFLLDGNLTINANNSAEDAILTFGNDAGSESLRFSDTTNTFEFSNDLVAKGSLSGSSLNLSALPNCSILKTDQDGNVTCGSQVSGSLGQFYDSTGGIDLNTGTPTAVAWDSETRKDAGITHSVSTDPERVILQEPGWYRVAYNVSTRNGSGNRNTVYCRIRFNGSTFAVPGGSYSYTRNSTDAEGTNASSVIVQTTSANEYYEVVCSQAGSAGAGPSIANQSWTQVEKIESGLTAGGWTNSGANVFTTNPTDSVGIGTETPEVALEVVGNISGSLLIGSLINDQSSDPPASCAPSESGRQWHDIDTGILYTCDTSNSRNKWLSVGTTHFSGGESGSCGSGDSPASEACTQDIHNGVDANDMGWKIPENITIVGGGFHSDSACTNGSGVDLEIATGENGSVSTFTDILSGCTDANGCTSFNNNIDINADEVIRLRLDNNCTTGSVSQWSAYMIYRWRHE